MPLTVPASISLCMIVRNEAANLRPCLEPVRGLFAETVVVDTGSKDDTKAIAEGLGARVYDFPWVDDFAAARNAALDRASGDWIFWLDADDRIDAVNVARLRDLFATVNGEDKAYIVSCVNTAQHASDHPTVISHARLFRRQPQIRWQGRVHEQILPSLQRLGHELVWTDVRIGHLGYLDAVAQQRKANRDLRLLRMEYAVDPHDPVVLYNLGLTHTRLGQYDAALPFLQRSLELAAHKADWVRKLFATLVDVLVRSRRPDEALRIGGVGLANFPNDPELSIRQADLLGRTGDLPGAEACLVSLLNSPPQDYLLIGVPADSIRKEARRLLGVLYVDQQRFSEAERLLRELLNEFPDYLQAQVNLGYVYLAQRRMDAVQELVRCLAQARDGEVYAWTLQAEVHIANADWDQVRPLLDRAIARAPQMLWPRLVLSDWLQKSGADWPGFLAVQRDILRLDPGNLSALQNLRRAELSSAVHVPTEQLFSWSVTT